MSEFGGYMDGGAIPGTPEWKQFEERCKPMSDANIPIIGAKEGKPRVENLALMGATIPELLSEIERKGVDIPMTTFQLVQSMCELRNQRWNAGNGGDRYVEKRPEGWCVLDRSDDIYVTSYVVATFAYEADAVAFANPQFTIFERAGECAGEIGELVNAVKKLRRHDMKMPGNYKDGEQDRDALLKRAAYEIGDGFVTLLNLTNKLNLDAWDCLRLAFNTKSDEMGFPEKL